MARKQTLKSLLGSSDDRVETSLNLDEVSFGTPRVQAGQYRVAVQSPPRTNTAGQLADALGTLAGPVLRQYKSIDTQRQEEFAEVASLVSADQAKAIAAGDLSSVQESLDELGNKLDSQQRKKLLKFVENPKNYVRASRVLGQKIGTQYGLDLLENIDEYAKNEEDVQEQFKKTRDDLIKNNNLTGYALEGFLSQAERIETQYAPKVTEAQEKRSEEAFLFNNITTVAKMVETGDFSEASKTFTTNLNGYTPEEQSTEIQNVINELIANDDFSAARDFVGWLSTNEEGIKLGAGANISEGTLNQLVELIDATEVKDFNRDREYRQVIQTRLDDQLGVAIADIKQGNKPETLEIDVFSGEPVEIDMANINNEQELLAGVRDAVAGTEMSETDKAYFYNTLDNATKSIESRERTKFTQAGVPAFERTVQESLTLEVLGENVFGMTDDAILQESTALSDEIMSGIKAIYDDNETYPTQLDKERASSLLVARKNNEFKASLEERRKTYDETVRVNKVLTSLNLGPTGSFQQQVRKDLADIYGASSQEEIDQTNSAATALLDSLKEQAREIITAPLSDMERANLAQAYTDRQQAVANLIQPALEKAELDAEAFVTAQLTPTPEVTEEEEVERPTLELNEELNLSEPVKMPPRGGRPMTSKQKAAVTRDRVLRRVNKTDLDERIRKAQGTRAYLQGMKGQTYYVAGEGSKVYEPYTPILKELVDTRSAVGKFFGGRLNERQQLLIDLTAKRVLVDNAPAITLDEIRSGNILNALDFDTSKLTAEAAKVVPILSVDMIKNPEENAEVINEYATALNIDTSNEDAVNKFIAYQALLFQKQLGIPFFK